MLLHDSNASSSQETRAQVGCNGSVSTSEERSADDRTPCSKEASSGRGLFPHELPVPPANQFTRAKRRTHRRVHFRWMMPDDLDGANGIEGVYHDCTMSEHELFAIAAGQPRPCTGMVDQFDEPGITLTGARTPSVRVSMQRSLKDGPTPTGHFRGLVCVAADAPSRILGFQTWTESPVDPRANDHGSEAYAATVRDRLRTLKTRDRETLASLINDASRTLVMDTLCCRAPGTGGLLAAHMILHAHHYGYRKMIGYRHCRLQVMLAGEAHSRLSRSGNNDRSERTCQRWGLRDFAKLREDAWIVRPLHDGNTFQTLFIRPTDVWFAGNISDMATLARGEL